MNGTILAVIIAIGQAITALFSYFLAVHNSKNDKQKIKDAKQKTAEEKIDAACDKGDLSDLFDATKELGNTKK